MFVGKIIKRFGKLKTIRESDNIMEISEVKKAVETSDELKESNELKMTLDLSAVNQSFDLLSEIAEGLQDYKLLNIYLHKVKESDVFGTVGDKGVGSSSVHSRDVEESCEFVNYLEVTDVNSSSAHLNDSNQPIFFRHSMCDDVFFTLLS